MLPEFGPLPYMITRFSVSHGIQSSLMSAYHAFSDTTASKVLALPPAGSCCQRLTPAEFSFLPAADSSHSIDAVADD